MGVVDQEGRYVLSGVFRLSCSSRGTCRILRKARKEQPYAFDTLLHSNCEHMAFWCKTGIWRSSQVELLNCLLEGMSVARRPLVGSGRASSTAGTCGVQQTALSANGATIDSSAVNPSIVRHLHSEPGGYESRPDRLSSTTSHSAEYYDISSDKEELVAIPSKSPLEQVNLEDVDLNDNDSFVSVGSLGSEHVVEELANEPTEEDTDAAGEGSISNDTHAAGEGISNDHAKILSSMHSLVQLGEETRSLSHSGLSYSGLQNFVEEEYVVVDKDAE